MLLAMNK